MAFLCPVRMRRDKKKATNANIERDLPIGRITGSSSIETLVRVGIEKEHGLSPDSKMIVLHDFTPCVDDELEAKRGQLVNVLYRENDWAYVICGRQEGFIPYSYCAPYNSTTQLADLSVKKKLPREQTPEQNENIPLLSTSVETADDALNVLLNNNVVVQQQSMKNLQQQQQQQTNIILQPECTPFLKNESGRYIVLYTFIARDENDISVERGEFVTVLNREDPDWFWIIRSDGQEGFIPSTFIYPADTVLQTHQKILNGYIQQQQDTTVGNGNVNLMNNGHTAAPAVLNKPQSQQTHNNQNNEQLARTLMRNFNRLAHPTTIDTIPNCLPSEQRLRQHNQQQQAHDMSISAEDLRFTGTELVMLYDYRAQAADDLSVRRGEWILADMGHQTVDGWLWSFAPKTRKYGFIPKTYARQQPQTQL